MKSKQKKSRRYIFNKKVSVMITMYYETVKSGIDKGAILTYHNKGDGKLSIQIKTHVGTFYYSESPSRAKGNR